MSQVRVTETELGSWSLTIQSDLVQRKAKLEQSNEQPSVAPTCDDLVKKQTALIQRQMQLIDKLSSQVETLSDRVASLEGPTTQTSPKDCPRPDDNGAPEVEHPRRAKPQRARAKSLSSVWYEWFCDMQDIKRQNSRRYHEAKFAVGFMKLFLPDGHDVSGTTAQVLQAGKDAEANILAFLREQNKKPKAYGTVVKTLKRMHTEGKLNDQILRHQALTTQGLTVDASHPRTVHVLLPQSLPTNPRSDNVGH
ncbi:hypothetical protein PF003_g18467 [Phytophthora fragariae]|nr:hypothetical protein PF003_g18467 [Phytophthora fragariae]